MAIHIPVIRLRARQPSRRSIFIALKTYSNVPKSLRRTSRQRRPFPAKCPPRHRHSQHGTGCGHRACPPRGSTGARAYETFVRCFEQGTLIRVTGDIIALSPPLIASEQQIEDLFASGATRT